MNTKFDEYFFQKLHLSLPLDVITFFLKTATNLPLMRTTNRYLTLTGSTTVGVLVFFVSSAYSDYLPCRSELYLMLLFLLCDTCSLGTMYCILNKYNVTLCICHRWINNSRNCRFCKSWRRYISSKGGPRWQRVPRLLWQLLLQERGWPKTSTIINSNVVTFRPWYVMNGCVLKSLWPCWRWLECIEAVVLFF